MVLDSSLQFLVIFGGSWGFSDILVVLLGHGGSWWFLMLLNCSW